MNSKEFYNIQDIYIFFLLNLRWFLGYILNCTILLY